MYLYQWDCPKKPLFLASSIAQTYHQWFIAGDDFKLGQTKIMKSVLVDLFGQCGNQIKPSVSIFSRTTIIWETTLARIYLSAPIQPIPFERNFQIQRRCR
jgi:hypothetical protein